MDKQQTESGEAVSVEAFNNLVNQVAAIAQTLSDREDKPAEATQPSVTIDDLANKLDELASKLSAAEEKSKRDSKSLTDSILSLKVVAPDRKTEKRDWNEMNLI